MEKGSNISSLQAQSQYDVKVVLKDSSTSDCIAVYAQRSILLNNSGYFAAQLSERWADTCKKDESGRPILEIKECESPGDYERALKKVYENPVRCDGEKPGYTFQTFEDAVGCLVPADHLGFSALLDSSVNYLESVPWTDSQTQHLLKTVSRVNFGDAKTADKLTKRTKAQMAEVKAALLDKVLAKAVNSESTTTVREGRLFVEALIGRLSSKQDSKLAAEEIVAGLQRIIFKLGVQLESFAPPMRDSRNYAAYRPGLDAVDGIFENHADLAKVVERLGWIFQLPMFPGQSEVMKEVVKVLIAIRTKLWDPQLYNSQIFHRYLAKDLYLWVMTAVKEGRCILDAKLRLELLRMWVPKVRSMTTYRQLHSGEMQNAFNAVLSTVSRYDQEQLLHQWLDDLMFEDPWQPWFKDWLEANLIVHTQALAVASTSGEMQ